MDPRRVIDQLSDLNPEAVLFDNMDEAIIGLGHIGQNDPVAVYSKAAIYNKLLASGLSQEDADEYFTSKFVAPVAYTGQHAPVVVDDLQET